MALERGLLPDDNTLEQLGRELNSPFANRFVEELRWPSEPLRGVLIRAFSSRIDVSETTRSQDWTHCTGSLRFPPASLTMDLLSCEK